MSFLNRLFGKQDSAQRDARRIYTDVMQQSRQAVFYGSDKFPDNYDGRIDVLTLHMGVVFEALRVHGEQGNRLAQALFDEMKDDFEVALREEGISDTGVAKRIKPMIQLFYTRVKAYTESFESDNFDAVVASFHKSDDAEFSKAFSDSLMAYVRVSRQALKDKSLGSLAQVDFKFPEMKV